MAYVILDEVASPTEQLIREIWQESDLLQTVYNSAANVGLRLIEKEIYFESCSADHAMTLAHDHGVSTHAADVEQIAHTLAEFPKWIADSIPHYLRKWKMPFQPPAIRIVGSNIEVAVAALYTRCQTMAATTMRPTSSVTIEIVADPEHEADIMRWEGEGGSVRR